MPSVTVVVSSDTDIYISPGLYGDCLPTGSTGKAADSFRAGRRDFRLLLHARTRRSGRRTPHRDSRHTDAMTIVKVT
ncbi:hypothetical protein E4U92_11920 [Streptomyces galbus]|uniref:Uncharacterized protein n=1 Tax=Streptomyces galbus TaxID=33898 RepID=A0A4U5X4D8_STRGB|nr:hypothetical protein E4U92_11920 [Streptomyces galbus]